ncbi:MAG TPA: hypothetical protein VHD36_18775 [Pirellulales bacterium]|nr:hypothetical protein [Pirellulales bacterium]
MKMPQWKAPEDIDEALAESDGIWEDERWSPILLTAMSGTELDGREIPIAWQIDFQPDDEACEDANAQLEESGVEPDGYGWGELIRKTIESSDAALASRLHLGDCESDSCVVWVESEKDCRTLIEATWKLMFEA